MDGASISKNSLLTLCPSSSHGFFNPAPLPAPLHHPYPLPLSPSQALLFKAVASLSLHATPTLAYMRKDAEVCGHGVWVWVLGRVAKSEKGLGKRRTATATATATAHRRCTTCLGASRTHIYSSRPLTRLPPNPGFHHPLPIFERKEKKKKREKISF